MDGNNQKNKITEKFDLKLYLLILGVLVIALILSLFFFYKPFYLYRPVHRFWSSHSHRTLSASDINTIRPWMTFDYINKVFKLPADYLKNAFNVSDSYYPNISLGSYANKEKINTDEFIVKVQEAVHNYLLPKN